MYVQSGMRLKEAAEVEASDRKAAMSSGLGGLRLGEPTCRGGGELRQT